MQTLLDTAFAHHRDGRLDEAAELYRRSLEAEPGCAFAWNMLGNVEYQRDDVYEALRLIGKAIEIDPATAAYRITLGHVHRRAGDLDLARACYRTALELAPTSFLAATSLADALRRQGAQAEAVAVLHGALARNGEQLEALVALGNLQLALEQPAEAASAFRRALSIDANSVDALFGWGVAARQEGNEAFAIECFEAAIQLKPDFAEALYNLGVIALERHRLKPAEAWLRRALIARPDYVDAHANLSAVLVRTGRAAEALAHREIAYRRQCMFHRTSPTAKRTVLILFDGGRGNINLGHLFSRSQNNVIDWMIEYAPAGQAETLPPFDFVFNAMGDPDMTGAAALPASRFLASCRQPVLNRPDAVALTSRDKLPHLLAGIDGLFVPKVWRVSTDTPMPAETGAHLPVLVRPVDTHGGEGLQRIACAAELDRTVAKSNEPAYVSAFCDFRSADGWYRKYRVIFIDREPLPYHLAISPHWLVHYATAGMEAHAWKLDEERRFLESPQAVLGAAAWAAVAAIGERLDLDYAGVDFSLLPDGRILVFEANPVMFVHPEDRDSILAFKAPYVARILDAFEAMLAKVCAAAVTSKGVAAIA